MLAIINNLPISSVLIDEIQYAAKIYFFWTMTHNVSLYLYNKFCCPKSFLSYFFTPLLATTPHCKSLFYLLNSSTDTMSKMMVGFSIWVIPKISYFRFFPKEKRKDI